MIRALALAAMAQAAAFPLAAQDSGFTVAITFDAASAERLAALEERVIVATWYYGEPLPGVRVPLDEMGMVHLGREEAEIWPGNQTVRLGGALGAAPLAAVVQPMVNVNIYSARLADDSNLLACGFIDGTLADAQAGVIPLACTLIDN